MYSEVARVVVRVRRAVCVEVEGSEVVVRSSFHLGRWYVLAAGDELPYETAPTFDHEQVRSELVRRVAGGLAGWVGDAPLLWLVRAGIGMGEARQRAERLARAGGGAPRASPWPRRRRLGGDA